MSSTNPEKPEPTSATPESTESAKETTERKQAAAAVAGSLGSSIKRKDDGNIDPLASIGGIRGLAESTVPGFLFMMIFAFTQQLDTALIASLAAGLVFIVARVVTRSQVTPAVTGLLGIALCAVFAKAGGNARDYYVPGFITNIVSAVVLGISALARWPLVGVVFGFLHGEETRWRASRNRMRVYQIANLLVLGLFIFRLAVQVPLYFTDQVNALGAARLVMGVPLYVGVLVLAWLITRPRTSAAQQEQGAVQQAQGASQQAQES
ncbi:DUF3159 domain-containing protein [Pseudoglutamicibacter cumminsii]|uniref:DUF3159 domain-containing protein n=1 Tax=Pseudoglutamicibacter cumminsii TaxID=156979 RepID=UPI0021A867FC|nr:DUF3159 domain-containing protein [Pseudoglutamicibacter cumminsii]MCT1685420.1 DUF3159 domain-containing protein [Pseudoglutamicibacter cumminsii]